MEVFKLHTSELKSQQVQGGPALFTYFKIVLSLYFTFSLKTQLSKKYVTNLFFWDGYNVGKIVKIIRIYFHNRQWRAWEQFQKVSDGTASYRQ